MALGLILGELWTVHLLGLFLNFACLLKKSWTFLGSWLRSSFFCSCLHGQSCASARGIFKVCLHLCPIALIKKL
ncbi:unnamed protein product [Moneuplotes crassus]|uniref:Uncharacterized protein n=1 Tax=Euplotes crassus TaxID=5936 RepID=A0AAD2D0F0_EUPCR|nr:unnamed protein product [Moneuplotes crassus]